MRTTLIAAVVVGVWLSSAGPLGAGLYNTAEPVEGPSPNKEGKVQPLPFSAFRNLLVDLIKIGIEQPETPLRQRYLAQRNKLQEKERTGTATLQDRINLSAYLIRLSQYPEALGILRHAERTERQANFMLLGNLSNVNQHLGELGHARFYLKDALREKDWSRDAPGWSAKQIEWYRRAEEAQLKLLELRSKEGKTPADTLDALFPVRFLGESGEYEAGKLAAAEKEKLPPDAVAIVQQLLIWMPADTRLYWLLGELYNAQGALADADTILDECVNQRRFNNADLLEHRRIVKEGRIPPPPASLLPNTSKLLIVGGLAGLVIVAFIYMQVREIRRRRQGSSSASKSC